MKNFKFILFFCILVSNFSFKVKLKSGNDDAEKIVGIWFTDDKTSKIQIYKSENQYFGKIIWMASKESKEDLKVKPTVLVDPVCAVFGLLAILC